jgi:hypothetical protein
MTHKQVKTFSNVLLGIVIEVIFVVSSNVSNKENNSMILAINCVMLTCTRSLGLGTNNFRVLGTTDHAPQSVLFTMIRLS